MRAALIGIQAAILIFMAVIGAQGREDDFVACPAYPPATVCTF